MKFGKCMGECSELICIWGMLAQFWASSAPPPPKKKKKRLKMGQNVVFLPFSRKVFTQSNSNLCCTLIRGVFRIESLLGHVGQIWASSGQKTDWKWVKMLVSDHYQKKSNHAIQFKLVVYACWLSDHNWFTFGSRWPNFGPLVATKWLKMVISDHYLKKYSCNPIPTLYVHLLGDCSKLIGF